MLALERVEELPAAPADFGLVCFAVEPGPRSAIEAGEGPLVLSAVEAGTSTFRVDTPTTVTRAGALATAAAEDGAVPGEAVPAATVFTLGPGDSAVFLAETTGEIRNAGAERAVGIGAFLESAEEDAAAGTPPRPPRQSPNTPAALRAGPWWRQSSPWRGCTTWTKARESRRRIVGRVRRERQPRPRRAYHRHVVVADRERAGAVMRLAQEREAAQLCAAMRLWRAGA